MDQRIRFQLEPTFPMDGDEIARRKWNRIFGSAKLLMTAAGASVVEWVSRLKLPVISTGVARLGGWLTVSWRQQNVALEAQVIQELIRASNRAQDDELERIMRTLRSEGYYQYAICLGQFLLLKQRIEGELHASGTLSRKKKELEILVDSLCASVCDQITQLVALDAQLAEALTSSQQDHLQRLQADEQEAQERIRHAYSVLLNTTERVGTMLTPGQSISDLRQDEMDHLDRLIQQLREENEVAVIVDEQLREIEESARRRS